MKQKSGKRWLGGYIRHGTKGPSYVIERWIDGKRFHVSTKCRTREAALEQLAIFEADPANYRPGRRTSVHAAPKAGVFLNMESMDDYLDWMVQRPKPATRGHMLQHRGRLLEWMKFYRGRDIREVELSEVAAHLKGKANLYMRVQALKSFCAWLRQEKFTLKRSEDPTLDLRTPAARATKQGRSVVITEEQIAAVFPHLPAITQDVMILRFGSGWHVEEVRRFAREGIIDKPEGRFVLLPTRNGDLERVPLLATIRVWQAKAEIWTATPLIHQEHLEAAERIRAAGYVPHRVTLQRHLREASTKAGLPRALWQWHIRHSVVSHAIEGGVTDENAGNFVDHTGAGVTRRHYKQVAHPTKAVPVLRILGGGKKS